jgi:hypothetical protein
MIDLQTLVAAVVVGGAFVYAAFVFLHKSKAFSAKNDCADDCGCGCSAKSKTSKARH